MGLLFFYFHGNETLPRPDVETQHVGMVSPLNKQTWLPRTPAELVKGSLLTKIRELRGEKRNEVL